MATIAVPAVERRPVEARAWTSRIAVPMGRTLFAAIFILASFGHFTSKTIAGAAAHGVPMANLLVPFSGVLALVGGLSIALGYRARLGAWLIVLFLVLVTLAKHNFWAETDPAAAAIQQIMFMNNVSMLGAALVLTRVGSGRFSVDRGNRGRRRPRPVTFGRIPF